ncbi:cysteine hydrolase [Brucella tritici]|uniref:Cysteine hydrolase n=1 Tax=Brucella tritici TaxID=94626 RepID=A0A7V7VQB6_9HYPH|nr:cysteine hydrolase [Brucella tritici]KAB2654854.1 cysteine hydrolase [Brucella tritici]
MYEFRNWLHICVDVQRMFLEDTPWHVPWMERVLPQIEAVAGRHDARTVFTRFIPPRHADDVRGTWRDYYKKWSAMTGERLPAELLELPARLNRFVPPARVFDKAVYSPWTNGRLFRTFQAEAVETVVITGGETDVCVLATVMGAIDLGFRVVVLSDAICSGADETHDKIIDVLADRFSVQLTLMDTEHFLTTVPAA